MVQPTPPGHPEIPRQPLTNQYIPGKNPTPFCYRLNHHEKCQNATCTCSCHWHGDREGLKPKPPTGSGRMTVEVGTHD